MMTGSVFVLKGSSVDHFWLYIADAVIADVCCR